MTGGSAEWIFVRGLVREAGHWGSFCEAFERRFPDARVRCLDLPGNGEFWRLDSPTTIGEMAAFLHEAVRAGGSGPVRLFSMSLGAMACLEWTNRHPEEIASAVLVNTSLRGFSRFHRRFRWTNYPEVLRILLDRSVERRERGILGLISNRKSGRAETARRWARIARQRPVSRRNALRQILAACRYRPPAAPPPVPLLILSGLGDRLVDPSCSQALAAAWHLPLRCHSWAGHDLILDDPGWVLDAVGEWMDGEGS